MTIVSFQPASPLASDGAALAQALGRAQVGKESLICVTGPAALTAMLWLARRGYDRAVLATGSAARLGQPADALLIPHACSVEQLSGILAKGAWLGEGGALIVQIAEARDDSAGDGFRRLLSDLGFSSLHRLTDRGRTVWIARRAGSDGYEKAA